MKLITPRHSKCCKWPMEIHSLESTALEPILNEIFNRFSDATWRLTASHSPQTTTNTILCLQLAADAIVPHFILVRLVTKWGLLVCVDRYELTAMYCKFKAIQWMHPLLSQRQIHRRHSQLTRVKFVVAVMTPKISFCEKSVTSGASKQRPPCGDLEFRASWMITVGSRMKWCHVSAVSEWWGLPSVEHAIDGQHSLRIRPFARLVVVSLASPSRFNNRNYDRPNLLSSDRGCRTALITFG